ncbi:MAG: Rrf2 family transcriptional regulator [Alphaproteobacteria bacterium]|nr:Rrf2 family transcriptional regulator [Alphaproteobacteria bacterium]
MRLTVFSDYALRMLMYGAGCDRRFTIEEVATAYGVSRAHMMKVANLLTRAGFLKAVRGRSGGLVLAKPAAEIGLREVIEAAEPDFDLVECFGSGSQCVISGCCKLQGVLAEAREAFTATLGRYTLADLALPAFDVRRLARNPDTLGSLAKPLGGVHV